MGELLRLAMASKNLNNKQLAELAGVNPQSVALIKNDKGGTVKCAVKIFEAMDLELKYVAK